ncbi:MAG: hypothetical protein IKD37_00130 [Clostridia bacterium]|nr:hypothetical protein [Clostridia bacterium]
MAERAAAQTLLISGLRLPLDADADALADAAASALRRAGIAARPSACRLHKRSIDARRRGGGEITFVCTAMVEVPVCRLPSSERLKAAGISTADCAPMQIVRGSEPMVHRPVVVGMGPAGLFAALLLAEQGYAPILLERGDAVQTRAARVDAFLTGGALDPESNVQFGAGGAGTFSDGKLVTRIHDPLCSYVLTRFAEFGAPEEILWRAKPHIGTDLLRQVISAMADRITALGGEIRYRCRLDDILCTAEGVTARTTDGDLLTDALILAPGHSARDTYAMLMERGFAIEPKPFSVGVRIEHLQSDIDRALFGDLAGHPALGKGEYALSDTTGDRGVYTFCMCPGGTVIAAASELGGVVVNGMSHHARDGRNANSAVAVSVRPEDYGNTPAGAIAFQRSLEQAAYRAGGQNYAVPLETVGDFLADKRPGLHAPGRIIPTYMNGTHFRVTPMDGVLPDFVTGALRRSLPILGRRLRGFDAPDALLSGVETRTSAPLRILRGEDGQALTHRGVYPCGEGAGYAGGITSAAVDGLRTALAVLARFAPSGKD